MVSSMEFALGAVYAAEISAQNAAVKSKQDPGPLDMVLLSDEKIALKHLEINEKLLNMLISCDDMVMWRKVKLVRKCFLGLDKRQ